MAYKFAAIFTFAVVASAGIVPVPQVYHPAPVQTAVVKSPFTYGAVPTAVVAHAQSVLTNQDNEYDAHPQYKFGYDVQDSLSGDSKSQVEERDGDVVRGEYSLVDADGFKRVVQYTSDPVNGFNAVVNRIPLDHVQAVVKAAPIAYATAAPANIVKEYTAPVAYHQHH